MSGPIDIGIDFGTTNCAVGRVTLGGSVTTLGPERSVGAWADGAAVFGEAAIQLLESDRTDVAPIRDLKLLLGDNAWPQFGDTTVDPVELAAELLKHLARLYYPDDRIGTAVFGTPVRVSREHRRQLREAATRAGFGAVRFVYEPTAALVGAWDHRRLADANVLVVDWGGGTLDLAVVQADGSRFLEQGVSGDVNDLGGSRIDREIAGRLLAKTRNRRAAAAVRGLEGGHARFAQAVEGAKRFLLEDGYGEEAEPALINPDWLPLEVELAPADVYQVMREFAARASARVWEVVHRAGLRPEDLTHVLFAGGVCRSEVIRKEVRDRLPWLEVLDTPDDPQLQTASGCARLADSRRKTAVELAADLAVRQSDSSLCVVLPGGQPVELNSYRVADFVVTDPTATEAVFDVGVCRHSAEDGPAYSSTAAHFQSLDQIYLPTGESQLPAGRHVPDMVRMHVGVDDCLAVGMRLESSRSGHFQQVYMSGVPLAIRVIGGLR